LFDLEPLAPADDGAEAIKRSALSRADARGAPRSVLAQTGKGLAGAVVECKGDSFEVLGVPVRTVGSLQKILAQ